MRVLAVVALLAGTVAAQTLIDPGRLSSSLRNLESALPGSLQCEVQPMRPVLNFGFRFQAGSVTRIPMKQYFGPGHEWGLLLRITPEGGQPVYLVERYKLPPVPRTNAIAAIGGGILLGEGRYAVAELLIDDKNRSCRRDWKVEARLPLGERKVELAVPPNTVCDFALDGCPRAARRDDAAPLRLTVLLDAPRPASRRPGAGPHGRLLLLGLLASLVERMPAAPVRLAVFSLDQQAVLYRNDQFSLGALHQVSLVFNDPKLSLVDYHVLQKRKGHLDLLAELVNGELNAPARSDVVVFLGPPCRYYDKLPADRLAEPAGAAPRFYYLQYQPAPFAWNLQAIASPPYAFDSIASTVSRLKGRSMVIHTPGELDKAIREMERPAP